MSNKILPKIIVILGPTASGKTKLATRLARRFNGEIVSADSRQVYRGMNIGTGKDLDNYFLLSSPRKRGSSGLSQRQGFRIPAGVYPLLQDGARMTKMNKKISYYLIDIINPNQNFNVAKYKKLALKTIKDILSRGKLPIIVGGTGLYISAIVDNYDLSRVAPDEKIRKLLSSLTALKKIKLLKKMDPEALEFVDLKNPRRLDRALEVCFSGHKFSEVRKKSEPMFDVLQIGLNLSRDILKKRIDARVDQMIKSGLIDETKMLIKKFGKNTAPLQTIGYKEIADYFNNVDDSNNVEASHELSLQKTINLIKIHTHQFAKRQMTWFKRDKRIRWIKNYSEHIKILRQFLQK